MKKYLTLLLLIIVSININAQDCKEIMDFVKLKSNGTAYTSYTSDAITKVTFYTVSVDYKTLYFVIVCFKKKYSYSCNEYIYQVSSGTKLKYALDHYDSAGKAFWKHIEPYNQSINCGANFDQSSFYLKRVWFYFYL